MPIITLPRFLISSGVMANAGVFKTTGAMTAAAPVKSSWRRSKFVLFSFIYWLPSVSLLATLPTHGHLVAAANLLSSRLPKDDSGQQRAKYRAPTIPKTNRGLKIWFETIVP